MDSLGMQVIDFGSQGDNFACLNSMLTNKCEIAVFC
jgi:hypothetical protein